MKPEYIFIGFLFLQFLIVFGIVVKYVIGKMVDRRFEELHKNAYPEAQVISSKQKVSYFKGSELLFLLAGPAVMAASMVYSLNAVLSPVSTQDVRSQAAENKMTAQEKTWSDVLVNSKNNLITLSSEAGDVENPVKLLTGEKYPYQKVTFSWSLLSEINSAKLDGYYVYFGQKDPSVERVNPSVDGKFTNSPIFVADNIEIGKKYYLSIQAVLSKSNFTYYMNLDLPEAAKGVFGKSLFEYFYAEK